MAWAMRQRSVSRPRSSNRTCGFPASGFPTGFIARPAAAAAGADGFFLETHPRPAAAPSDGATMWPLDELESLVERAIDIRSRATEGSVHA